MEGEDAPDIDREKSETIRRKYKVKRMMTELVEDMIRIVEPTSVVSSVVDTLVEKSSLVGAVNDIWHQLEGNKAIMEANEMRMEEEERDNKLLLEIQLKEERMERQIVAKSTWQAAGKHSERDVYT